MLFVTSASTFATRARSLNVRRIPRGVKFFFKPIKSPTAANAFVRKFSERNVPSSAGKSSSDAFCSGVWSCVSTCQRRTSMTSDGTVMRWRNPVFVVFMSSSFKVCERRTRITPWSQRTSGVSPLRLQGRIEEGRSPVAKPKKVIAYCPGNSSFMQARNLAVSSLVSAFGSSSVYVSCSEVSNAGNPSAH